MAECSLSTLIDEACESGFRCLDEKTFRGVLLQLLCDFAVSGGGAGQQNFSGSGPPTTQVPANDSGTYYDYTNQSTYHWNPITPGWE